MESIINQPFLYLFRNRVDVDDYRTTKSDRSLHRIWILTSPMRQQLRSLLFHQSGKLFPPKWNLHNSVASLLHNHHQSSPMLRAQCLPQTRMVRSGFLWHSHVCASNCIYDVRYPWMRIQRSNWPAECRGLVHEWRWLGGQLWSCWPVLCRLHTMQNSQSKYQVNRVVNLVCSVVILIRSSLVLVLHWSKHLPANVSNSLCDLVKFLNSEVLPRYSNKHSSYCRVSNIFRGFVTSTKDRIWEVAVLSNITQYFPWYCISRYT